MGHRQAAVQVAGGGAVRDALVLVVHAVRVPPPEQTGERVGQCRAFWRHVKHPRGRLAAFIGPRAVRGRG